MTLITSDQDTLKEIKERGFSILSVDNLHINPELNTSKLQLMNDWTKLVIDKHMQDGGKYRYRRYGRFSLDSKTRELTFQGDVKYFQSEKLNPLNGGMNRSFAPLIEETIENKFLHELIRFDFDQLLLPEEQEQTNWNVGIHQFHIVAELGQLGQPAPEGIHKDGEMFTVQHLIERNNIKGGENAVYDNDKNLIHKWTQQNIFDSYYFKDTAIYHSVSEISSADERCIGYRDILLIDFDPIVNI